MVAVFMLVVIGAMMALSIDVVTFYTARSEAQLAADAAALAGARTLANSGMTSGAFPGLITSAEALAVAVATQVAANNQVGGRNLNPAGTSTCTVGQEICVSFNDNMTTFGTNPHVTVRVQRADLPTFFARIWGSKQITVGASATAEAYNPSTVPGALTRNGPPVAPICVKPWLLPNMDPSAGGAAIFAPDSGAIQTTSLLGWSFSTSGTGKPMSLNSSACPGGSCTQTSIASAASPWQYYPGDDLTTFPHPTNSLPSCATALTTPYQESIAGCIQTPISCNSAANIDLFP
ncbi:MAG: pilus assembly protein TadG-related protein, partial [Terriglobales bacterium]